LNVEDDPNSGLVSFKFPRAMAVAFGIPLSSGFIASVGPE
jgi:hypothetical protein